MYNQKQNNFEILFIMSTKLDEIIFWSEDLKKIFLKIKDVLVCYLYVLVCYSYISVCYSYVFACYVVVCY